MSIFNEMFIKPHVSANLKPEYIPPEMFYELVDLVGLDNAINPAFIRGYRDKFMRKVERAKESNQYDYDRGYDFKEADIKGDIADRMRREWDSQRVAV